MTVFRFTVAADPELLDALSHCLLSAGAGALEEGASSLSAYTESQATLDLWTAAILEFRELARASLPDARVDEPEITQLDDAWQTTWQAALVPEQLTERLTARPTHTPDAPPGERTIWLEPQAAFGEGGHTTTQLAARAIERLAEAGHASLLDVGTGSGILLFVALKSGFSRAVGIDSDAVAVSAAQRNAELNGLTRKLAISSTPLAALDETFPVVVANIVAPVLLELAEGLAARLAPGGTLLLTGLLTEDAPGLERRFAGLGLSLEKREQKGDWCLLQFNR